MNLKRANEIINSSSKIEVIHNGKFVWLNALDPTDNTVIVDYTETQVKNSKVPVSELIEGRIIG